MKIKKTVACLLDALPSILAVVRPAAACLPCACDIQTIACLCVSEWLFVHMSRAGFSAQGKKGCSD